eukprot:CAMPEP_0118685394 /NCGR_PEP_ID=MMETSP0800-20121206/7216_1 /TAXON_ID=210618 ORGANISM="Striatella unipunctata, Strain CCMP2910" /NCGR_SAMPLE_ID=MMETSP0800 /ASSEMBLY_ACC=CAM_ASM_000638 /LENGTH=651 /DNA_ID=CAMNT_0006582289 /DNA_START=196 /DNA_END=2151 /DNA_ORIENTATION=+
MVDTFETVRRNEQRRLEIERQLAAMEEVATMNHSLSNSMDVVWDHVQVEDDDDDMAGMYGGKNNLHRHRFASTVGGGLSIMDRLVAWHAVIMSILERQCSRKKVTICCMILFPILVIFFLGFSMGEHREKEMIDVPPNAAPTIPMVPTTPTSTNTDVGGTTTESTDKGINNPKETATSKGEGKVFSPDELRIRLLDLGVTQPEQIDNAESPQNAAYRWMSDHAAEGGTIMTLKYALATLFYSTHNETAGLKAEELWKNSTNWLDSDDICVWHGVKCMAATIQDHKVFRLNLTANGLSGSLPLELVLLQDHIVALDLTNNNIMGPLHPMYRKMHRLTQLMLGYNSLTGTLPPRFSELTGLTHLYLDDNEIHGYFPKEWKALTNLEGLGLYKNLLEGTLPKEIGDMKQLMALYLDSNQFEGSIPSEMGSLQKLVDLRLRHNRLQGTIPFELGNLAKLKLLYLDTNLLTGDLPFSLAQLVELRELHLYHNELDGTLPDELGMLDHLRVIYFDNNKFRGTIPVAWESLRNLESLYLFNNQLDGSLTPEIGGWTKMIKMRLEHNKMTGRLPSELGQLTNLETLYLRSNQFWGELPTEMAKMTSLQEVDLAYNLLTGQVSQAMCDLDPVEFVVDCGGSVPPIKCDCCECIDPSKTAP